MYDSCVIFAKSAEFREADDEAYAAVVWENVL